MNPYKFSAAADRGVFEWLIQRISGIILVLVILVHFFSMIKTGTVGVNKLVLGPLFAFGLYHAFNGFKMITDDYVFSYFWRSVLLAIYWIAGIILMILALSLTVMF